MKGFKLPTHNVPKSSYKPTNGDYVNINVEPSHYEVSILWDLRSLRAILNCFYPSSFIFHLNSNNEFGQNV